MPNYQIERETREKERRGDKEGHLDSTSTGRGETLVQSHGYKKWETEKKGN